MKSVRTFVALAALQLLLLAASAARGSSAAAAAAAKQEPLTARTVLDTAKTAPLKQALLQPAVLSAASKSLRELPRHGAPSSSSVSRPVSLSTPTPVEAFCAALNLSLSLTNCTLTGPCDPVSPEGIAVECSSIELEGHQVNFKLRLHVCETVIRIDPIVITTGGKTWKGSLAATGSMGCPGLTIGIPFLADAGVFIGWDLEGEHDAIRINLGVQACAEVIIYKKCLPKYPIPVIHFNHKMDGVCP